MEKIKLSSKILIISGSIFLVYAYLGNYIALPGISDSWKEAERRRQETLPI
ncbi:MAG: hypothetical protein LBB61_08045 [Treponema sp.]|jgi:hypothetical protein|nr:hypothetical protein [Treponema sp.]